MNETVTSLYICPWSLRDPLCQSQSLAYLDALARGADFRFALLTFETPKYKLAGAEFEKTKRELARRGIYWYPVEWQFNSAAPQKAAGALKVFAAAARAVRRHKPRVVHSRSSMPAFFALAVARVFHLKFLYDADSVLSQEYVDVGHFSPRSASYKFLARVEAAARRRADALVVLTDNLKRDFVENFNVSAPIEVIPCCVNVEEFSVSAATRDARRSELNLAPDGKLLVYVGKVGVRYLTEEVFAFFKTFARRFPSSRLLIVSGDEAEKFRRAARKREIADDSYFIKTGDRHAVKEWLAAGDAGLCLIHRAESERGSSPIKFSEYLSSGLPVVITSGVGDSSALVRRENLGVVLDETDAGDYDDAARELMNLCNGKAAEVSARCRRAAREHYSLEAVGVERYKEVYRKLLQT